MTRLSEDGIAHRGGGGGGEALPREESRCCGCFDKLFSLFSSSASDNTRNCSRRSQPLQHVAPIALAPHATRTLAAESRLVPHDSAEQRYLLPKCVEANGGTTSVSGSSASGAASAPSRDDASPVPGRAPAPREDQEEEEEEEAGDLTGRQLCRHLSHLAAAAMPLGLGTPAVGGGGLQDPGGLRSSSATTKAAAVAAAASRHRRTQSSGDHHMQVVRIASRTSQAIALQQCAALHAKRPSLTTAEFGKGFSPSGAAMSSVAATAVLAAAAACGATAADFDDDSHFCPTCLELYTPDNPKSITACGHHFHLPCLYAWLERKDACPMCDSQLLFDGVF